MAIHDQYFVAAVARHLIRRCLQKGELKIGTVGDSARLVACFRNLTEIIFRKDNRILLLYCLECGCPHIDQIRSQGS